MVLAYKEQIKFLDRLKLVVKAMKGLPPDTNFAQALAAASAEAYAIAFKAWEARMERERARSEKARREKL